MPNLSTNAMQEQKGRYLIQYTPRVSGITFTKYVHSQNTGKSYNLGARKLKGPKQDNQNELRLPNIWGITRKLKGPKQDNQNELRLPISGA